MQIKNRYSFGTKIKMAVWLLRTKLIWCRARLIRFPFDLRGRKFIDPGENLTTGVGCRLEAFSPHGGRTMHFGKNVQMNDYVHICAMQDVTIGDNVLMAGKIYISDNSHGCYKGSPGEDISPDVPPIQRSYRTAPVHVGDNVWIGEGVVILPGVTIGRGAVIGANSVVNRDIPAATIAVGQPARPVKRFDPVTRIWQKI